jgi:hypothetical protein
MIPKRSLVGVALLALAACSGDAGAGAGDGEWSGTVTTEGNVTTVVNERGSVWGGDVAFVEEASIGVEAGEDPYMLGSVRAVAATVDEIYVLDQQVPAVRVYDMSGRHLRDIGSEGSGPAELRRPDSMVIGPDERIYVRDYGNDRIMVFSPQGEEVGTLPLDGGFATSTAMIMTLDGTLYNYQRIPSDDPQERLRGLVPRSLEAGEDEVGEPMLRPDLLSEDWSLTARTENMSMSMNVPFAPSTQWTVAPSGAAIVGASDDYSFEIRYPDGRVTRVVKRYEPVPVEPAEAEWLRASTTAAMRRNAPEWTWNGKDIPATKPAYQRLHPDHSGRVWVARPGPASRVAGDCNENPEPENAREDPCWETPTSWEVFDQEGRFLGGADVPDGVGSYAGAYIKGDMFVVPVSDDMGTIMVKRYRLVYPGDA